MSVPHSGAAIRYPSTALRQYGAAHSPLAAASSSVPNQIRAPTFVVQVALPRFKKVFDLTWTCPGGTEPSSHFFFSRTSWMHSPKSRGLCQYRTAPRWYLVVRRTIFAAALRSSVPDRS
eukprot:2232100-Rhodomonas_salina.2